MDSKHFMCYILKISRVSKMSRDIETNCFKLFPLKGFRQLRHKLEVATIHYLYMRHYYS